MASQGPPKPRLAKGKRLKAKFLKVLAKGALKQVAALPLRLRDGRVEVCLVTTRTTGRWTVPKGWPIKGCKDFTAAHIEAEEEAGVTGRPHKKPVGSYLYWKRRARHFDLGKVKVYPVDFTKALSTWKEQGERLVRWVAPEDASIVVEEAGLEAILGNIGPKRKGKV